MDALVICGGRGTRLGLGVEKPLLPVGGRPMVDRVCAALAAARVGSVYAAVSPHAPETAAHVDVPTVETPGEGYVADLDAALADDRLDRPVLTAAADLPLLDGSTVDAVLDAYGAVVDGHDASLGAEDRDRGSLTVAVPVERTRALGVSVDTTFEHDGRRVAPAGINVVGDGPDRTRVIDDARLAVNVNRPRDAQVAEALLVGRE